MCNKENLQERLQNYTKQRDELTVQQAQMANAIQQLNGAIAVVEDLIKTIETEEESKEEIAPKITKPGENLDV